MVTVGVIMSKHRSKLQSASTCSPLCRVANILDETLDWKIGEVVELRPFEGFTSIAPRVVKLPKNIAVTIQDTSV